MGIVETGWSNQRATAVVAMVLIVATGLISSAVGSQGDQESNDELLTLEVFEGYYLRFWVSEYRTDIYRTAKDRRLGPEDICFLGLLQVHYPPAADTLRFDSLRQIDVANFCAFFYGPNQSYCPAISSISVSQSHYWSGSEFLGPFYEFGVARLRSKSKQARLSFVASLSNRESGEELDYRVLTVVLQKEKGDWVISEHQFER